MELVIRTSGGSHTLVRVRDQFGATPGGIEQIRFLASNQQIQTAQLVQALAGFGFDSGAQVSLGNAAVRQAIAPHLIAAPS